VDPRFLLAAALAAGGLAPSRPAAAQAPHGPLPLSPGGGQEGVPQWDARIGFSYLATSGNSETSSAGFDAALNRAWRAWSLEASAAGVSATKRHRRTAESYNALARLKRRLRKHLQLTLGLRWERNRFAGLDARETADVSVLWEVRDTPGWKVRALGGLSLSREEPRGDRAAADAFGGLLQVSGDARISATASWDGQVSLFPNFEDWNDYRVHGHLGLQAALNPHLGLRLGYDLKFDHEPVAGFGTTDTATTAALVLQLGKKEK
jgi:putative salt-induced outer membrane protein YdiY